MLEGLDWCPIYEEQARWLERPFEDNEIKEVVFDLEGDKASGPDGFSLSFFQACCDVVMKDLLSVFADFYRNGEVCKNMNSNFISLIPKKAKSSKMKDSRPISLTSNVYNIL